MYGLLGNFEGQVTISNLSPLVYARVKVYEDIGGIPVTKVIIVKNETVSNVYNLPVYIWNGEVVRIWNGV